MSSRIRRRARKASLIAFGLVALSAFSVAAQADQEVFQDDSGYHVIDPTTEASRAYAQALSTLSTITALPPSQSEDAAFQNFQPSNSLVASLMPNLQGHGPIASAMRILLKLRSQSFPPRFLTKLFSPEAISGRKSEDDFQGKAVKVIDLLEHAAELGSTDALYTLGQISLMPPNSFFPSDPVKGYKSFSEHASLTGNASSQALVGFYHATGYHNVVPVDQALAQLYLTFSAHGGHKGAQMALGYRYWTGIGVAEDCLAALSWYEDAAEQAMARFLSGPPGGRTLPLTANRLSDLAGGVYGPGASVASTGLNAARPVIKTAGARAAGETWEDLMEYYLFNADRGEIDFAYRLGKIFYHGSIYAAPGGIASAGDGASAVPRDYARARHYFLRIARQVWPRDHPSGRQVQASKDQNAPQVGYAALAAGYIGRMYLRGEGVKQDAAFAKMWFERGAEYGEKECQNGLGIIWRDGLVDGRQDMKKALACFGAAASQELAEAQVNLGKYHYNRGDLKLATMYFETAIRQGSPFEAYYYLAEIQARQARNPVTPVNIAGSSCAVSVSFYKIVAERSTWDEDLVKDAEAALNLGTPRGVEQAMLRWWMAAERGYEAAQNNLAFVLDQDKSILRFTSLSPISPSNDTARLALTQWIRSAAQRNIDALVKVGDYYYYGLGVPDEPESVRWEKAAGYYQSAADTQLSALAMWNLGWMYENGLGVPQDFHLAKRHYDLAYQTNSEAYLPVLLSLVKLYARSIWHTLTGGRNGLSLWGNDAEMGSYYDEPENREIGSADDGSERVPVENFYDDGPWYLGRAKDEFNRRRRDRGRAQIDREDDPVQWARDRRNAEAEPEGDFGPEDYFDAATRRPHHDAEGLDESTETFLLVFLFISVSLLLYVRGRWVHQLRRDEEQRQRQQEGGVPNQGQLPAERGLLPALA